LKILGRWKCSYQRQGVAIDALDEKSLKRTV
jgi:hypothetical protein